MPTKVDADAMDVVIGRSENDQEPGGINKTTNVTHDQEPIFFTNTNLTDADTDADMGYNQNGIF